MNIPKSQWGTYYVTARDLKSGHESAILVYMDWPNYGDRNKGETGATRLSVSLDKKTYNVGDQATLSFPSIVGSRAIISIENGSQVLNTYPIECNEQNTKYSFEVTPEMQPNVYLNVTLLQPYGKVGNDLPVRLYGIIPLTATSRESILQPIITCADNVLPESTMEITVSEKDGRPFAYTLALVDEGLLDLTQFRTPNPWAAFNAKVALGVSTWDIYKEVLGGYGGKIEQMFAIGGDNALDSDNSAPINRFPPMVKYLGVFELKAGKESTHKVTLPAYMGRVRVMVVAISNSDANAWGSTEKSVAVRSPLMILGSAPRAVAVGDELVVAATLIATEDAVGSVTASIKVNENVFSIMGDKQHTVSLTQQGDKIVLFRVKVKDDAQIANKGGRIQLSATSSKGRTSTYAMDIPIRTLSMPVSEGKSYTVDANKKWDGAIDLQGMIGTRRLMLEVSSIVPINSAQRMEYLSKYPYGCIEQITSAVFPILYLMEMVDLSESERTESEAKIRLVLNKYKSYATPDGMMGYWPGSTNPNMWGSAYALHFMAEARSKGYTPPAGVYERLKTAVKSTAIRWNSSKQVHSLTQAYQLYALALADAPELGAMNRLRQSDNMTSEAKWMLAAAYATAGRSDIGKMIVANNKTKQTDAQLQRQYRTTYGSQQREQAVQLLGASLLGIDREASELALTISTKLASKGWMSTQTSAWCMMAIGEYLVMNGKVSQLNFEWKVDGKSGEVVSESKKMVWSENWENPSSGSTSIENNTKGTLHIRLVSSGISSGHGVTAAANGVKITVRYLDNNDNPINISTLVQGTDFISEVTVENLKTESLYNLMLTEPMASGWEIRPDGKIELKGVDYQDIRDDRVNSFIPQLDANETIVVRTRLNATYGGVYLLPSIRCGAMYDGEISGHTASGSAIIE